jgi:hypothetical protein
MTQQSSEYKPFVLDRLAINGGAWRSPSGRACGRMIGRVNDLPLESGHVPVECRSRIGCCMVAFATV